jgi:hypothetical protein
MFALLPSLLSTRGTRALLLQVVVNLMMNHRLLNTVHRPFGFG